MNGVGENPLNGNGVPQTVKDGGVRNSLNIYGNIEMILNIWWLVILKKFDKEYSTQYTPEMKYLLEQGIKYTFVKDINGVTTYKYTKTPELFRALEFFYSKK